jgi:predicted Ser/Thr protein kinase
VPSDDELAQTATAPGAPAAGSETVASGPGSARELAQTKLGRFELETVLGTGGMGVVHAAYDPELERRVAVKVLHKNADARARLLREARAMAKLSHANVITVFDVGTADGEDFVAMELIEGGTLGDWIESTKPRPRDVIAAFVAAGRGLVAAHAEGLVHRDFKPSNVLRSQSGRIVVTDFGLARAEGADGRASRPAIDQRQESTAPALTKTGSLLGTPAYMAPEQWRFEAVTPATDQFAFCVALWEALSGKRPFVGATLDDLREDVLDGPVDLDDAGLPRMLRPVLRRGLAVDPEKRWPSMSELLAAIEPASSRRSIAVMAGVGLATAGIVMYLVSGSATMRAPACVQPAIDPDSVTLTPGAKAYVDRWRTARESACKAKREVRVARLACLDGVFARIADAFHDRNPGPDALADELVDPSVCGADQPPHLLTTIDGRLSSAFAVLAQAKDSWKAIDSELAADTQPPCVRTVALLAARVGLDPAYDPSMFGKAMALVAQLQPAAAACDDDAIKAQAAFAAYTGLPDTLGRVEQAAKQFPSDANLTALAAIHADEAVEAERPGDALVAYESVLSRHAAAGRKQAELETALEMMKIHLDRSNPEDLDAVMALADRYGARARELGRGAGVAALAARARWRLGQVDAANLEARTAGSAYSTAAVVDSRYEPQNVKGTVVDERGRPVANAKVVAGAQLWGDDAELSSPVSAVATTVETTTKADGTFELVGARKMAMASHGDQVSLPVALTPSMTLRLGPTSTVEGDVALGSEPFSRIRVGIFIYGDETSQLHAGPVDRDGHFKLSRIPRGKQQIAALLLDHDTDTAQDLDVTQPVLTGVHVRLATKKSSNNVLYIIGRSETANPPDAAMAYVLRGAHPNTKGTVREILSNGHAGAVVLGQRDAAQLALAFKGHVEADDLTGELPARPDEDVTICAVGLSNKLLATITSPDDAVSVLGDGDVGCVVVSPNEALAVVMIPAVKRR